MTIVCKKREKSGVVFMLTDATPNSKQRLRGLAQQPGLGVCQRQPRWAVVAASRPSRGKWPSRDQLCGPANLGDRPVSPGRSAACYPHSTLTLSLPAVAHGPVSHTLSCLIRGCALRPARRCCPSPPGLTACVSLSPEKPGSRLQGHRGPGQPGRSAVP